MKVKIRDTIDKIVESYFSCITNETFEYKGEIYEPKELYISPKLLRGFKCPSACGGCCPRFTLDYLPEEPRPESAITRSISFNNQEIEIFSDIQNNDNTQKKCGYLDMNDGRCGIYTLRPFSCDFELIRFLVSNEPHQRNSITQKLFGRGWAMMRIDGDRGALCEMTPPDQESVEDCLRKLNRLKQWADHFKLKTKVDLIIRWVYNQKDLQNIRPLVLNKYGTEDITIEQFMEKLD